MAERQDRSDGHDIASPTPSEQGKLSRLLYERMMKHDPSPTDVEWGSLSDWEKNYYRLLARDLIEGFLSIRESASNDVVDGSAKRTE